MTITEVEVQRLLTNEVNDPEATKSSRSASPSAFASASWNLSVDAEPLPGDIHISGEYVLTNYNASIVLSL